MAKFKCIKKNFGFQKRVWEVGDIAEVTEAEMSNPSLVHFKSLEAPKQSQPKAEGQKPKANHKPENQN